MERRRISSSSAAVLELVAAFDDAGGWPPFAPVTAQAKFNEQRRSVSFGSRLWDVKSGRARGGEGGGGSAHRRGAQARPRPLPTTLRWATCAPAGPGHLPAAARCPCPSPLPSLSPWPGLSVYSRRPSPCLNAWAPPRSHPRRVPPPPLLPLLLHRDRHHHPAFSPVRNHLFSILGNLTCAINDCLHWFIVAGLPHPRSAPCSAWPSRR